jgi:8-hydroxy-5-deazaflavin:NADPH oxidoreductase
MSTGTKVAIIGAGNVGGGLGVNFSKKGLQVKFGVRPDADIKALLEQCKDASASAPVEAAAWADVVFLAVPGTVAVEVAKTLAGTLKGKVVVDCNNPLVWKDGPVWTPPPEGSLAAAIASVAPGARVVKGFNTFGAEFHKEPGRAGVPADVFLAGDDQPAKKLVTDVATQAGFHAIDAGPLRNAPVLENLAILWIHLATVGGQGRDFTFILKSLAKAGS